MQLPARKPGDNRLTLFMELDDTLLHTYIYDENFGFMSDPNPRDPDFQIDYSDKRIPIKVYMRDCAWDFLKFLKDNKDKIEPIVYTSGIPAYANMLVDLIDPKREVFEHRLYQNACYLFEKRDEDIFYMIKDITRFKAVRDMSRSILIDPNPLNFILSPENGLPFVGYNAELHTSGSDKDEYLIGMSDIIKEVETQQDVRAYLKDNYNIR